MCMFVCISRGDQLLEVDSVSLRHAALSEAYAILSECGPGPVSLIISRHPNPKVRGKIRAYAIMVPLSSQYSLWKLYTIQTALSLPVFVKLQCSL